MNFRTYRWGLAGLPLSPFAGAREGLHRNGARTQDTKSAAAKVGDRAVRKAKVAGPTRLLEVLTPAPFNNAALGR